MVDALDKAELNKRNHLYGCDRRKPKKWRLGEPECTCGETERIGRIVAEALYGSRKGETPNKVVAVHRRAKERPEPKANVGRHVVARPKAEEKETIIRWTEADDTAEVFTCSRKLKNKMEKLGFESTESDDEVGGETYEVPIEYVQFRKPREITDEQREAAAERFRIAREERLGSKKKKSKKSRREDVKSKKNKDEDDDADDDDEEEDEEEEAPKSKKSKKGSSKSSKKSRDDDDDDDDEEDVEVVRRKKSKSRK